MRRSSLNPQLPTLNTRPITHTPSSITTFMKLQLLLPAIALASFANLNAQSIVARVGGETITTETIKPYLAGLSAEERTALQENPQVLSQTVRNLLLQQVLLKEALAANWDDRPEIKEQIEQLRHAVIAESYLAEVTKAPDNYPTEAEIREVYEARKDELQVPKQFELSQIYLASVQNGTPLEEAAIKQRVEAVQKRLNDRNADFAEIAREVSDEKQTGARGGALGFLPESSLQPEIRKVVTALGKGQTSAPVKLEDGTYFVKVTDIKDAHTVPFEEIKERLAALLREQRARINREAYLTRLQQATPMTVNEFELSNLLTDTPTAN